MSQLDSLCIVFNRNIRIPQLYWLIFRLSWIIRSRILRNLFEKKMFLMINFISSIVHGIFLFAPYNIRWIGGMIDLIRMLMVSESSTIHCGFYIISVAFQHSKYFWMAFRRFSFHAESIALRQITNAKWIHWSCMIHSILMKLGSFYDSDGFALEMASISWIML